MIGTKKLSFAALLSIAFLSLFSGRLVKSDSSPEITRVTTEELFQIADADLQKIDEDDRRFYRYFSLSALYNRGSSEIEIRKFRIGLAKLLNSLSWEKRIA